MRIPNAIHLAEPWRIHDIVADFTLEDVWALPVDGAIGDFAQLIELITSLDPSSEATSLTRVLWGARDLLGRFGLGRISTPIDGLADDAVDGLPIPGTVETSLVGRLADDVRGSAQHVTFRAAPFRALYRTDVEFAAELSNPTVHCVMHLAWVEVGDGHYRGQLAVYAKPRGPMGTAYMALIKPFRLWIVYPALMHRLERTWSTPNAQQT